MTKKDNGKTATNPDLDSLLLNGSILLTAASAGALVLAYNPKYIHVVSRFSSERQTLIGCEFVRVLALESACMLLWTMLSVFMNVPANHNIFTVIIFATTIVYAIMMSRAK